VKDTGYGIKEEDKSKLFKLFGFIQRTQDKNTNGIGLGLSITKKIVGKFGGKVGVRSIWGEGSTFAFSMEISNELQEQKVSTRFAKTNEYELETPRPVIKD
jgi:signal transduction histidine kinase